MANPTKLHWLQLCRLASYLAAHPQLELVYAYQELPSEIYAEVDADWAGCVETRRSTDGGFEFFGKCVIDAWSSTQQSIALSSGESELYGICNGSARILWTAHLLKEMGFHMNAVVATDSSAAKGVSARLGAGRIRHLETRCLWIQERVRAKELEVRKVWTDKNRADMQTKPLDPTRFWMLMGLLPLRRVTGCKTALGGGLMTAIIVSSIGGAQAAGPDTLSSTTDGLWWFLASILYSSVVAYIGWWLATPTRTPATATRGPRPLDEVTETRRVQMRAYWELDLARLRTRAGGFGMPTSRATRKNDIVRWLLEREYPWLDLVNAEAK